MKTLDALWIHSAQTWSRQKGLKAAATLNTLLPLGLINLLCHVQCAYQQLFIIIILLQDDWNRDIWTNSKQKLISRRVLWLWATRKYWLVTDVRSITHWFDHYILRESMLHSKKGSTLLVFCPLNALCAQNAFNQCSFTQYTPACVLVNPPSSCREL